MLETVKDMILALVLAGICAIGGCILKANKRQLLSLVSELIQRAETAVSGSGMGAEKKALVIAQLEAMGIRVTAWLDGEIDRIVALLNHEGAWLTEKTNACGQAAGAK